MARQLKYPPDVVRDTCCKFLAALDNYSNLLANSLDQDRDDDRPPRLNLAPARIAWADFERYGSPLLAAGRKWKMSEWVASHEEWAHIETSQFFEDVADGASTDIFSDGEFSPHQPSPAEPPSRSESSLADDAKWGFHLERFVAWKTIKGKPFGFAGCDGEDDSGVRDDAIEDVAHDVRALLAAAREQLLEKGADADIRPRLTPKAQAVLDLILNVTKGGITGKEIIDKLENTKFQVIQSVLTSHIIPKLMAHYGVANSGGVGYYCTLTRPTGQRGNSAAD